MARKSNQRGETDRLDATQLRSGELGPLLHAAIEANEELRNRSALKSIGTAAAMADALTRRDVAEPAAQVSAEIGVLAFKLGYALWADPARDEDPGELVTHTRAAFTNSARQP
ncbi:hypothetical protein ABZ746_02365 [Streptomyces sp. NPDC020096]